MYLHLDHHSGEPIYQQIIEAIKYKVASGQLALDELLLRLRYVCAIATGRLSMAMVPLYSRLEIVQRMATS